MGLLAYLKTAIHELNREKIRNEKGEINGKSENGYPLSVNGFNQSVNGRNAFCFM
jgi:hypothetical protein